MQIGIVEICEPNHYSAVIALAETYATDVNNQVTIFTVKEIAALLQPGRPNISLKVKPDNQTIAAYLDETASSGMDRLHINTISRYYKEFALTEWRTSLFFTVHNIDNFFANKPLHRLRLLWFEWVMAFKKISFGNAKDALVNYIKEFDRQRLRNMFIKKVFATDYKILIYSNSQKKYLEQHVKPKRILIFPFCLHEDIADTSATNTKLRVCIPGTITDRRRNYTELVEMVYNNLPFYRDNITFDMLGYIPANEIHFAAEFEKLRAQGADIIYTVDFVDNKDFDARLGKADVILGNLKVQLDPYRKYGETKETGVIFNVIKAGKPAILPKQYTVDEELQQLCLFFDDNDSMHRVLEGLVSNSEELNTLKNRAMQVVKKYNPEQLYHLLA